jgi:hypothetical protein
MKSSHLIPHHLQLVEEYKTFIRDKLNQYKHIYLKCSKILKKNIKLKMNSYIRKFTSN